jgi:hypothetical protein
MQLSGLSAEELRQCERDFLTIPPLEQTDPQVTVIVTSHNIPRKESDNKPLTQATSQPTMVTKDRKPHRVSFTWREWIYDDTGKCSITYSNWSKTQSNNQVYAKETRYGGRLEQAQIESQRKFKQLRAAHQAMLCSVNKELQRQQRNRQLQSNPYGSKRKSRHTGTTDHPSSQPTECSPVVLPALAMRLVERVLNIPIKAKVIRVLHKTRQGKSNRDIPVRKSKTTNITTTTEESSPQDLKSYWKQHTRGVRALHTFHTSYLLPLPWQHHAWTAPAHRKALRQQPFTI